MRHLLAILVLLLPAVASGDEWGLGLRASAEHVASSAGDGDPGVDLGGGAVLVRWRFWPHWGLEAALGSVRGQKAGGAYDRRSDSLLVTLGLHLTPGSLWDCYLFLGVGGASDHVTVNGVEQTFKQSEARVGVGLERRWRHLGLGAELAALGLARDDRDQARPLDAVPARSAGAQVSLAASWYF